MIKKAPFQKIYDTCNAGNSRLKFETLPSFPRIIDLELTNTCNFRCLMCPTGNFSQARKKGFMDTEIFHKLIDEAREHKPLLRFIGWGEPLTHPKVFEFIRAATDIGCLTHLNTNGSKLDKELIGDLLDTGLTSIKFSFQGVDKKSYNEMRNIDYYDELADVITLFHSIRGKRDTPFIHCSTSITYETPEMVEKFKTKMQPITDLITVGRTTFDHMDLKVVRLRPDELKMLTWLRSQESVVKTHPECPEVYDKLSLNWDGTISACCMDSDKLMAIGSLRDQALKDIWECDQLNEYREILAQMRHDDLPLCKNCYDYASLSLPGVQNV
jgi:radical SAM protein with 4Fe4S-binding SPASM domain